MRVRVAGLILACAGLPPAGADLSPIDPGLDYHSFANVDQFRATHIDLDLRIDLEGRVISGIASLEFKRLDLRSIRASTITRSPMSISSGPRTSTWICGSISKAG